VELIVENKMSWYIADLIVEAKIEDTERNLLEIDSVLIQASSNEEALEKSMEVGKSYEDRYKNPDGRWVIWRFHGLQELTLVDEKLEHGAELFFTTHNNVTEEFIKEKLRDKKEFQAFKKRHIKIENNEFVDSKVYELLNPKDQN